MKKILSVILSAVMAVVLLIPTFSIGALAASLPKVTSVKAYNIDDDEINLKWSAVKGATGYRVYMYNSSVGSWKRVGSTKKTKIEVDDLTSAKAYRFKVRAYKSTSSGTVYGPYSKVLKSATEPDEPDNLRVKSKGKTSITLKWSPVKRATVYQIYFLDSKTGKYVYKKGVKGTTAKITGLSKATSYKIKIRAYFKSNGKKYYSSYTDVITVKTSGSSTSASSASSTYIGKSKAKTIALNHAGVSASNIYDYSCSFDGDDRVQHYEIEFESRGYDYEYEINAKTGKIISYEIDN